MGVTSLSIVNIPYVPVVIVRLCVYGGGYYFNKTNNSLLTAFSHQQVLPQPVGISDHDTAQSVADVHIHVLLSRYTSRGWRERALQWSE